MTTEMFTVYDIVAAQCRGVFHAMNKKDAVRQFRKSFKDNPDAGDFRLLKLGDFNHDNGVVTALEIPEDVEVGVVGGKSDA